MNTLTYNAIPGMALAITVMACGAYPALAADSWQQRMLFEPTPGQLEAEAHGRIMIYDGMTEAQIASAMNSQFDRIGSMMFVRTVHTDKRGEVVRDDETGTVEVDDDGC